MDSIKYTALVALIMLSGCATMPPLEFYPAEVSIAKAKLPAELRSVTVKTAPEKERTGKVNWFVVENTIGDQFRQTSTGTGVPVLHQWESALTDAVTRSILFRDDAPTKVSLTVDVLKVEMRGLATVSWDIEARYRVFDRSDGTPLYEKVIKSEQPAHTSEAFVGAKRARLGFVRSVTHNIELFIRDIEAAGLRRPNQAPEPTPTAGTSAAEQPLVPAAVVAHL